MSETPKNTPKVLEVKTDPRVVVPFLLLGATIIAAAFFQKISAEMAAMMLAALGFPSMFGVKSVPDMMSALAIDVREGLSPAPPASTTPMVLTSTTSETISVSPDITPHVDTLPPHS